MVSLHFLLSALNNGKTPAQQKNTEKESSCISQEFQIQNLQQGVLAKPSYLYSCSPIAVLQEAHEFSPQKNSILQWMLRFPVPSPP